jgi:hypothetical protein
MDTMIHRIALVALLAAVSCTLAFGDSGAQYRRYAIMNANQVRTVFGNWGVIAQPATAGHRGAWRNDNDGYIGDVSILVGSELTVGNQIFHSVATCPVDRPTKTADTDPNTGKYWTLEPVGGYFAGPPNQKVAISTDPTSWPPFWPDKQLDPLDPGWKGKWNGYFGKNKISADEETYFAMDDNNDQRFNFVNNNIWAVAFHPDSTNLQRNGMGLVVTVRALQWAQFLAKDNIFWLYEITNTGTTTYNKMVFGMLVGTFVGVTSTESGSESSDDWSFYDPTVNITYTGDFKAIHGQPMTNPLWVGGTGLVGYAFLESPGNPYDGIDNDGDADSSAAGISAPPFVSADFDTVLLSVGKRVVLINDDFSRSVHTIAATDTVLHTRGLTMKIRPGVTKVVEGNVLLDATGNPFVNANAYDGVDNNFNGLIDENYRLHYHQTKVNPIPPHQVLFDILRPLRHVDYLTGAGTSPFSMIDERRDDRVDNNLNWNIKYDDVGIDGLDDGAFGAHDGLPTSGYDVNFHDTGLPGEPHIDKTDVKESDQIGLTNFSYFSPSGVIVMGDKESLWQRLIPGFFDVPATIVGGVPQAGEDGDFVYGSGYFPLLPKSTERFSLALVYGGGILGNEGLTADLVDLLKHKQTVQKIYDANYQFPQPPDKPTLTAVPGDRRVTLYWDRRSEASVDPVLLTKNFEGYRLYKSTDPNFSDIFTITDGSGSPQGYKWLQEWDLKDGITGYFQAQGEAYQDASGFTYYLGSDNGLVHTFVDSSVDNGRRYFYALVAYSKGDQTAGIFPAENTHFVTIASSGEITHDQNVVIVTPNAQSAGYSAAATGVPLTHVVQKGTGLVNYVLADQTKITGHRYQVQFFDTQVDSVTPAGVPVGSPDSTTWNRITKSYSVLDLSTFTEQFVSHDTLITTIGRKNFLPSSVVIRNHGGAVVPPSAYILNPVVGSIKGSSFNSLPAGNYTISYQYYPVFKSPNILGSPFATETKDADIFDGVQLSFQNSWRTQIIDSSSGWTGISAYVWNFSPTNLQDLNNEKGLFGYARPADYEFQFSPSVIDTSLADDIDGLPATPTYFRVYNRTDSTYVKFIYYDGGFGGGRIVNGAQVILFERNPRGGISTTWSALFSVPINVPVDTVYPLGTKDRLVIKTMKPFRNGDIFEFTPTGATVSAPAAKADLSRIKVVPNPYVTQSQFELPLNPGITSGRGQRKIDFIHIPAGATVKIFTARGDYVQTLRQDGNIEDGAVSWDLKTYENLDVSFGVYFYVVESPVGNATGKIAIIK